MFFHRHNVLVFHCWVSNYYKWLKIITIYYLTVLEALLKFSGLKSRSWWGQAVLWRLWGVSHSLRSLAELSSLQLAVMLSALRVLSLLLACDFLHLQSQQQRAESSCVQPLWLLLPLSGRESSLFWGALRLPGQSQVWHIIVIVTACCIHSFLGLVVVGPW